MSNKPKHDDDAIHNWFGLTYAQFLVVPRVVMSEMPAEWQEKMVALLDQMGEAFDYMPDGDQCYYVRVAAAPVWPYEDEDGNPVEPVLRDPPEDLCNYRHPSIARRRKVSEQCA